MTTLPKKLYYIIVLGIGLQLCFLFFLMEPNALEWSDPKDYFAIASRIANGNSFSLDINNLYRSPGYPYFLSVIISLLGPNILLVRLVHIFLFSFFIIGTYKLGALWLNKEFGILFSLLSAIYPYFIYIPLTLYPEALLIYISPWVLYYLLRISQKADTGSLIMISVLLSIGVLTRPTYLAIGFIFALYYLFMQNTILNKIKILFFAFSIPLVFIVGWGYRNYLVHDHFIISTAANINLYKSYNENSTIYTKSNVKIPEEFLEKLKSTKNIFEQDSLFKIEAIKFIRTHPAKSLFLATFKCLDLWNPIPHTVTNYPLYKKIIGSILFITFLLLSILGFYKKRNDPFIRLLLIILIFNTVSNGIFAVSIRYRVVFDIIILLTAVFWLYINYSAKTWFMKIMK